MYSIKEYFNNPGLLWISLANHGFFDWMSDERYLSIRYKMIFGKKLNLNDPKSFNEKIQWLKINDRKPIHTTMVDKATAKVYAANIIGEKYIIPTLGVWNNFDDIDFEVLPNQFVLKCTHDSGGLVIVRDKGKLDKKLAKKKLNKCLKKNFYYMGREWPYKNVKPRIIVEQYIENNDYSKSLNDYKFFVFDGKVEFFYVTYDRGKETGTCFDFYNRNMEKLPVRWGYKNSNYEFEEPEGFDQMIELAEKLGENEHHIRVDFYNVDGKIYFGELTFYTWSGLVPILPEEWDYEFGKYINFERIKDKEDI